MSAEPIRERCPSVYLHHTGRYQCQLDHGHKGSHQLNNIVRADGLFDLQWVEDKPPPVEPAPSKCGAIRMTKAANYRCDLPSGHAGFHCQKRQTRAGDEVSWPQSPSSFGGVSATVSTPFSELAENHPGDRFEPDPGRLVMLKPGEKMEFLGPPPTLEQKTTDTIRDEVRKTVRFELARQRENERPYDLSRFVVVFFIVAWCIWGATWMAPH